MATLACAQTEETHIKTTEVQYVKASSVVVKLRWRRRRRRRRKRKRRRRRAQSRDIRSFSALQLAALFSNHVFHRLKRATRPLSAAALDHASFTSSSTSLALHCPQLLCAPRFLVSCDSVALMQGLHPPVPAARPPLPHPPVPAARPPLPHPHASANASCTPVLVETVDEHILSLPPVVARGCVMICTTRLSCCDTSNPIPLVPPFPPSSNLCAVLHPSLYPAMPPPLLQQVHSHCTRACMLQVIAFYTQVSCALPPPPPCNAISAATAVLFHAMRSDARHHRSPPLTARVLCHGRRRRCSASQPQHTHPTKRREHARRQ